MALRSSSLHHRGTKDNLPNTNPSGGDSDGSGMDNLSDSKILMIKEHPMVEGSVDGEARLYVTLENPVIGNGYQVPVEDLNEQYDE